MKATRRRSPTTSRVDDLLEELERLARAERRRAKRCARAGQADAVRKAAALAYENAAALVESMLTRTKEGLC